MNTEHRVPFTIAAAFVLTAAANAQTITVTTSADVSDTGMTPSLTDLPGPDGVVSLREALRASDATVGIQTVGFAIPEDDWYLADIFPGLVLLQGSFNWSAFEPVIIDGTTQTAFTGDTNPDGHEVALYGLTLVINGDGSTVTGLYGSNLSVYGSSCEIYDNDGNMDISCVLGSGNQIYDNVADTIAIQQSSFNVVVRNTTQRVRISGGAPNDPAIGNRIGGPDPADRNFITGWGNYGEHGVPGGTTVELYGNRGTLIENNYIGTTPDGMSIGSNSARVGVGFFNIHENVTLRNNLIAAQATGAGPVAGVRYGEGIYLDTAGGATGVVIADNTIGLNAAGEPVFGGVNGVWVSRYTLEDGQDVRFERNVIAGHDSTGVLMRNGPGIVPQGSVRLTQNAIYANGEIGIDLTPNTWTFGPTPNDPMDADIGANGLQNFPDLTGATRVGGTLQITGELHSGPFGDFTIEFFASPACDASGFGQGQEYLGSTSVFTDIDGDALFDVSLAATVADGWVVTATATAANGETSEFSGCVAVKGSASPGVAVCFGDGSGTPCPCGNESTQPGRGCRTTAGDGMYVTGSGGTSVAADDLALTVHDVPIGNTGIFYAGRTGLAGNPLFDGLQCAGGSTFRFHGQLATSSTVTETAFVNQDVFGLFWVSGATYTFQYFSRDNQAGPSPCGGFANLSSAYAVTMTP